MCGGTLKWRGQGLWVPRHGDDCVGGTLSWESGQDVWMWMGRNLSGSLLHFAILNEHAWKYPRRFDCRLAF